MINPLFDDIKNQSVIYFTELFFSSLLANEKKAEVSMSKVKEAIRRVKK